MTKPWEEPNETYSAPMNSTNFNPAAAPSAYQPQPQPYAYTSAVPPYSGYQPQPYSYGYSYSPHPINSSDPLGSINGIVSNISSLAHTLSSTLYTTQATYATVITTLSQLKHFRYKRYILLVTLLWFLYRFWGIRKKAMVVYDFEARGGHELSVEKGETVWLLNEIGEWVQVEWKGKRGVVPKTFVKEL